MNKQANASAKSKELQCHRTSRHSCSTFAFAQLKETELDEIYNIDLEMSERVHLILKTVEAEINETMSAAFVNQQVREIDSILIKRTNFINQFK
jgi:hypothetical protein